MNDIILNPNNEKIKVFFYDKPNKYAYLTYEVAMEFLLIKYAVIVDENTIKYISNGHDRAKLYRLYILERDNHICYYCGKYGDTIEHLKPKCEGGKLTLKNCVCACLLCNSLTHNKFNMEAKEKRKEEKQLLKKYQNKKLTQSLSEKLKDIKFK
jgi:hypothetical protein